MKSENRFQYNVSRDSSINPNMSYLYRIIIFGRVPVGFPIRVFEYILLIIIMCDLCVF